MQTQLRKFLTYCGLTLIIISTVVGLPHRTLNVDLVAFLCGGEVIREHKNPYVMQPLYQCEQRRLTEIGRSDLTEVVTPSPLPAYALAEFSSLSLLPTNVAVVLWDGVLLAGIALTVYLISILTGLAPIVVAAAIFLGDVYVALALGQITPVIVAAIVLCSWATFKDKDLLAAFAGALTMSEPNIGLPVCLALFCIRPKARIPLIAFGCLFGVINTLAEPYSQTLTYFHETLPAHASSEIKNDEQLSLTHLLYLANASDRVALLVGSLSYVILLGAVAFLSFTVGRVRSNHHVFVVFAPALTAIGGTYLHVQQFVVVSILGLLALKTDADSVMLKIGVMLVSLPLISTGSLIESVLLIGLACVLAADFFVKPAQIWSAIIAAATCSGGAYLLRRHHAKGAAELAQMHRDVAAATLHAKIPEDVWRVFINEHVFTALGRSVLFLDGPLFIGYALVIVASYNMMKKQPARLEASTASNA